MNIILILIKLVKKNRKRNKKKTKKTQKKVQLRQTTKKKSENLLLYADNCVKTDVMPVKKYELSFFFTKTVQF
jgi:hypothetical protein